MDPIEFLLEKDPFRVSLTAKVASRSFEMQQALNEDLAIKIVNTLAKSLNKT